LLRVYHSNSLDTLRDLLVEMIARDPISDPFCAEKILVQSPGMAQWLKLEIAQRLKIAANIDFPLPASFLWRTFANLLVDVPERSAYSKESMTWVLMRVLPNKLASAQFATLNHYLTQDQQPFKLYQLCEKIADLFDQYLVYRPDWIANWESDDDSPVDDTQSEQLWQPILWREIVADTKSRELPHWHRANMFGSFIDAINEADAADIPRRVFVFGISALPENYLQALVALGNRCDIHLMVANPCRQFWSDIVDRRYLAKLTRTNYASDQEHISQLSLYEQGNPLLASMGKLGRDYLYLLNQLDLPEVQLFSEDDNAHLLSAMQSDILSLRSRKATAEYPDQQRLVIALDDQSVKVHNCYSAMREVEVLQDQLLAMLEDQPDLEPRDIIVMMPDVAIYSPFIEAVFGQAAHNRYLPFSISDRNAQQESPLIANFLQLLQLSKSRYGASQILELLSLPALLRRFELDEVDFEHMRRWILESGIKWGLDEQNRQAISATSFAQNSWQFGLDRMFAGFALGDTEQTWQGIAPYAEIAGLEGAVLGQLARFVELLHDCKEQFSSSAGITAWVSFFHQLIEELYAADDADLAAIELIYNALESLQTTIDEAKYEQQIPADIIVDYLQQSLTQQRSGQRFLSGQVNFCTLMPMRAIPFKVVCLLGMNDGDYPRSIPAMGFDLMAVHSRKGDRSRRDDDRYLFLEALLSARNKLYISYVGRSIADNSVRAPSVLVSELLEYIQQGYYSQASVKTDLKALNIEVIEQQGEELKQQLLVRHPLTAYHRSYFSQDSELFSFAKQWLPIADVESSLAKPSAFIQPLDDKPVTDLTLSALVAFFKQPVKYFFQQRLQVNFLSEEEPLEDEEPFALSGLDNYVQRDELLKNILKSDNNQRSFVEYLNHNGTLPIGVSGDQILSKNEYDVQELAQKLLPLMQGDLTKLSFDLNLGQTQLTGWIEPLYDTGVVKYSAGKSSGRSYISSWVEHLAACANGCQHVTYFRAINEQFHYQAVEPKQAKKLLYSLLNVFYLGQKQPLSWEPDLGWKLFNSDDVDKFNASALKDYNKYNDPYIHRAYPRWQDISIGLHALNDEIFAPLSKYLIVDTQVDTDE
jgi:exodeoxyribonuclease V gamma subunit